MSRLVAVGSWIELGSKSKPQQGYLLAQNTSCLGAALANPLLWLLILHHYRPTQVNLKLISIKKKICGKHTHTTLSHLHLHPDYISQIFYKILPRGSVICLIFTIIMCDDSQTTIPALLPNREMQIISHCEGTQKTGVLFPGRSY